MFKFILFFYVLNTLATSVCADIVNAKVDFIKQQQFNSVKIKTCQPYKDIKIFVKLLAKQYIYFSFTNIATIGFMDDEDFLNNRLLYIIDTSCSDFKQFFTELLALTKYIRLRQRILLHDSYRDNRYYAANYLKIFDKDEIRLDSDVVVMIKNGSRFLFHEIYNTRFESDGFLFMNLLGVWTGGKLNWTKTTSYHRRQNMHRTILKVSTVQNHKSHLPTVEYLQTFNRSYHDSISKVNFVLFMILKNMHNFSYSLNLTDNWFGTTPSGVDKGLAKLLYERYIDMVANSAILKVDRLEHVDFVMPVYPFRSAFMFLNPGTVSGVHNEFLTPFSDVTWYATVVCAILALIAVKLAYYVEDTFGNFENERSWALAAFITIASFAQQGIWIEPRYLGGRLALFVLLGLNIMLYNYYTSSIVSSLLSTQDNSFKTLMELAQSQLDVGMEEIPYMKVFFLGHTTPEENFLYKTKISPSGQTSPHYYTPLEGIARVQQGGFAYHTEPATVYNEIEKTFSPTEICELCEIELYKKTVLYTFITKYSQYKEYFLISYMRMAEYGILQREQTKWLPRKPICMANSNIKPIGIEQASAAFILLCMGIGSSLLILACEIANSKYNMKKKIKSMFRTSSTFPYTD